ncbi:hypothetical protein CIK05_14450 [Bdellovibrio sp. qaytius]|nr:hypothetical protein CIK05_14450 [Bdellovibrio sp. qaytius]
MGVLMGRIFEKFTFSFAIILFIALNVNAGGAIAGKVTILKGQVFIQRGSAKILIKKDDTILESDIIESESGTARITMIDSNLVDVYPRSRVEIAKYVYKPNQDEKEVELKVDFGKIKSTVNQKYDGAKNKFQVKTPSAVAGVRGTVFTTEYDAVKKVSKVITIEGLVAVTKMLDRERQTPPVFVRPDQVVKVDVEQSKTEQPRDLKPEEKESRQKEDKDLGYQYDPKKDAASQPDVKSGDAKSGDVKAAGTQASKEPAKEQVKEVATTAVSNSSDHQQLQQQDQGRRQKESEGEQAKKQKQLEDEQAKKQKQLDEEQAKRQKQLEEEQAKKQKQIEEEQQKRQQAIEEAQIKAEAEIARRAQETAKRAETTVGLPSVSVPDTNTITPRK